MARPQTTPPSKPQAQKQGWDEIARTIIGLVIAVGGFAALIAAWLLNGPEDAQALSAILLGLVGSVLGYHFGSRGIDRAEAHALKATKDQTHMLAQVKDARDQVQRFERGVVLDEDEASMLQEEVARFRGFLARVEAQPKTFQDKARRILEEVS